MSNQIFVAFLEKLNFTFNSESEKLNNWNVENYKNKIEFFVIRKKNTSNFGAFDETRQGFCCGCPNSIMEVEFQHGDHQFYL